MVVQAVAVAVHPEAADEALATAAASHHEDVEHHEEVVDEASHPEAAVGLGDVVVVEAVGVVVVAVVAAEVVSEAHEALYIAFNSIHMLYYL